VIAEFLTRSRVEGYRDEMVAETERQLKEWREGKVIDVHAEMLSLTVRISAKTLLGLDLGADWGIVRAGAESLRLVLSPRVLLAPWDLPGLPYRRFVETVGEFNRRIREKIEERRVSGGGCDVLSALVRACDEDRLLSEAEVVGHASVVYAASHETTGNALTWALFLLSQHPEWQERVCEEVRDTMGSMAPSREELERLKYLDWVLLESLRVLPSAPWTTRVAAEDAEIGGYPVPAGTEIVVSIFHTHRDSQVYGAPDSFEPARWGSIQPDPFEFNAFSAGPRACVGSQFALLEMKLVLAMVLKRFRLEFDVSQRVDPELNITLAPRRGLRMIPRTDADFSRGKCRVRGRVGELVRLR
jgi:cytochrome P450